jgi:hypothetical protein
VTPEVKTWKSRVNAITRHVLLRFGSSRLEAPLTWPANDWFAAALVTSLERSIGDHRCDPSKENRL